MLIQTPPKEGDTVTLKLSNGEEIIATLKDSSDSIVTVSKVVMLVPSGEGMGFAPWLMTASDEKVNINKNNVLVMLKTQEEIAKMYTQATTGIVT